MTRAASAVNDTSHWHWLPVVLGISLRAYQLMHQSDLMRKEKGIFWWIKTEALGWCTISAVGVDGRLAFAVVVRAHQSIAALRVVDLGRERTVHRNLLVKHHETSSYVTHRQASLM
jgi:hypothetical protein